MEKENPMLFLIQLPCIKLQDLSHHLNDEECKNVAVLLLVFNLQFVGLDVPKLSSTFGVLISALRFVG